MQRKERPSSTRRAESRVGRWKESFAATVPKLTPESTMSALKSSIDLYLELASPRQKELSVAPADQARRVVLQALGQSP